MSFGERMRQARERKGLTQKELASLLGLQESSISLYETNKREPRLEAAESISKALDVSIDWLLGRTSGDNVNLDALIGLISVERDWPEVITVLRRSGKKPTPEERRKIARIIRAAVADNDEEEE